MRLTQDSDSVEVGCTERRKIVLQCPTHVVIRQLVKLNTS